MAPNNISEDIEVLSKKLLKDPASRLFLPLAEKYRDAGMLEEAETVLRDGLKYHPDYTGAQFSLGRILHEKGDTDGAFGIFREVVRSAPDNLLAHKKLADIAIKKGLEEEAVESLRMIVRLDPRDANSRELLERYDTPHEQPSSPSGGYGEVEVGSGPGLETFEAPETPPTPPKLDESSYLSSPDLVDEMMAPQSPGVSETDTTTEVDLLGESGTEQVSVDLGEFASDAGTATEEEVPQEVSLDDLMPETSGNETGMGLDLGEPVLTDEVEESSIPAEEEAEPQITPSQAEEVEPAPAVAAAVVKEDDSGVAYELPAVDEIQLDQNLGIEIPTTLTPVEGQFETEYTWGAPDQLTAAEGSAETGLEQVKSVAAYEISDEEEMPSAPAQAVAPPTPDENLQQLFSEIAGGETVHETVTEQVEEEAEIETETMAELYIQQGHYEKARDIYTRLLDADSDNSDLRQKLEEVHFMINLLNQKDRP
ncbi:MAG: tetratricopeptide repeat protein [Nitrospirota bacterium]|nr:tetratricopeptide repeat protein [Nitrospirota bacterium]